jgi:BirA family biotin operon repressor/biotin-[acetyl-CoA-carboxylase] ligase
MASPFHIIKFDSLPSTNRYLREHYRSLSHNTVVVARHQSAGRGRFDRQWVDDGGNSLLVSMLLKEDEFNYPIPLVSLAAALAVAKSLDQEVTTQIKWPNYVLIQGKKVAGILLEGVSSSKMDAIIVGIGLNLNQSAFPLEIATKATSLALETGKQYDKDMLLMRLLTSFSEEYHALKQGTFSLDEYKSRLVTLGQMINYEGQNALVVGISPLGALQIKVGEAIHEVTSGEVEAINLYQHQK